MTGADVCAFDLNEIAPGAHPDYPDPVLDAAYRSGIVPAADRWESDFTYRPAPLPDALTILTALHGRVLAKRVEPDGRMIDYDQAARFNMTGAYVRNLDDIAVMLRWLLGQYDKCIIRGDIASGQTVAKDVPRWLHPREGGPATIADVPHKWLAVDIDEPAPTSIEPGDLFEAAQAGMAMLPPEFRGCDSLCQATASHGIKPGLRIRSWFWLSRAVSTAELRFWFRKAPVDPSVFGAAQVVYTAAPVFVDRVDPVPERLVRVIGLPEVPVPPAADLRPKPKPQPARRSIVLAGISPRGKAALDRAEGLILRAKQGQRDTTLFNQAYRVGCVIAAGDLPEQLGRDALLDIGQRLPAYPGGDEQLRDKINRAVAAGMTAEPRDA
jgi:hypothetical protein